MINGFVCTDCRWADSTGNGSRPHDVEPANRPAGRGGKRMGAFKALTWSLLSGGFMYLYMTNHFIKANWIALVWIVLFATQMTIDLCDKKDTTRQ